MEEANLHEAHPERADLRMARGLTPKESPRNNRLIVMARWRTAVMM